MSYPGGKGASGVVQQIINQQPPHDLYVEPYFGGGRVFRAKRPAASNILIDLSEDAIGAYHRNPAPATLAFTSDALWFLREPEAYGERFTSRTLIYCDPPYPLGSRRRARKLYDFEMTDAQHLELITTLRKLRCMVQISSYENRMYSTLLKDWRLVTFQARTRGCTMTEHLWMNYPEPVALHDFSHLGIDYRERERIRRKTVRWVNRIQSLPKLESVALLSALSYGFEKTTGADPAPPFSAGTTAHDGAHGLNLPHPAEV